MPDPIRGYRPVPDEEEVSSNHEDQEGEVEEVDVEEVDEEDIDLGDYFNDILTLHEWFRGFDIEKEGVDRFLKEISYYPKDRFEDVDIRNAILRLATTLLMKGDSVGVQRIQRSVGYSDEEIGKVFAESLGVSIRKQGELVGNREKLAAARTIVSSIELPIDYSASQEFMRVLVPEMRDLLAEEAFEDFDASVKAFSVPEDQVKNILIRAVSTKINNGREESLNAMHKHFSFGEEVLQHSDLVGDFRKRVKTELYEGKESTFAFGPFAMTKEECKELLVMTSRLFISHYKPKDLVAFFRRYPELKTDVKNSERLKTEGRGFVAKSIGYGQFSDAVSLMDIYEVKKEGLFESISLNDWEAGFAHFVAKFEIQIESEDGVVEAVENFHDIGKSLRALGLTDGHIAQLAVETTGEVMTRDLFEGEMRWKQLGLSEDVKEFGEAKVLGAGELLFRHETGVWESSKHRADYLLRKFDLNPDQQIGAYHVAMEKYLSGDFHTMNVHKAKEMRELIGEKLDEEKAKSILVSMAKRKNLGGLQSLKSQGVFSEGFFADEELKQAVHELFDWNTRDKEQWREVFTKKVDFFPRFYDSVVEVVGESEKLDEKAAAAIFEMYQMITRVPNLNFYLPEGIPDRLFERVCDQLVSVDEKAYLSPVSLLRDEPSRARAYFSSPENQKQVDAYLELIVKKLDAHDFLFVAGASGMSKESLQPYREVGKKMLAETLGVQHEGTFKDLQALFEFSKEELVEIVDAEILKALWRKEVFLEHLETVFRTAGFEEGYLHKEVFKELASQLYFKRLIRGVASDAQEVMDKFGLVPERFEFADQAYKEAWEFYHDATVPLVLRKAKESYADITGVRSRQNPYSVEARHARMTHFVSPKEYQAIATADPFLMKKIEHGEGHEDFVEMLIVHMESEGEDFSIVQGLMNGRDYFGAKAILQYMNRADMRRHDALFYLNRIIDLHKKSELSKEAFVGNILLQVAKDQSQYRNGSAHAQFREVVSSLQKMAPIDILKEARLYDKIESLQELVKEFSQAGGVKEAFSSWKNLQKLYELQEMLQQRVVLEKLNEGAYSPALRRFAQKVAFHPGSSGEAVIKLLEDPAAFFDIDDELGHTPRVLNDAKKPSNYLSLPYLGMRAEDLREAIVDGTLERLQTLPPMERGYVIAQGNERDTPEMIKARVIFNDMIRGIGRHRKGVPGKARSPKKAFHGIRQFCREHRVDLRQLVSEQDGPRVIAELSDEAVGNLKKIVYLGGENDYGVHPRAQEAQIDEYRVRMGSKGDPDMMTAGDDTASCMPFGSGKQNVYMCNPNCVQMIVERRTEDGWKTAAQSVVNIDLETGKLTPELINDYLKKDQHLEDLVDRSVFQAPGVVTCDNIEIAKNEEGRKSRAIVECYRRFFQEYLSLHAKRLGVDAREVAIGTGYTGVDHDDLIKVDNTLIPLVPMGYSDNIHRRRISFEVNPEAERSYSPKTGMAPMTSRDVIGVSWLEGKSYQDNKDLLYNLHKMQNNIVGMEIANEYFDRPGLSFVHRDDEGVPDGYLLAYEGQDEDRSFIYVSDIAVDPGKRGAGVGGELMQTFLEAFARSYGSEKRPFMPVFANLRESTSYAILKAGLDKLAAHAGLKAEMVEVGVHDEGGETMHDVFLVFGKTQEDIDAQKEVVSEIHVGDSGRGGGRDSGGYDYEDYEDEGWLDSPDDWDGHW